MSDWPQKFLHAFKELHHYDSITAEQEGLSLADAYDVQHQYVHLRKETITGYKAALTAPQAQAAMGIDVPIIGALFAGGEFNAAEPIQPTKSALLETEIGFRVARAVTDPVTEADVLDTVEACIPMIEIASPNLATKPNGLDLIATNAASYGYLLGQAAPIDAAALDTYEASLARGDETLLSGTSAEVLGGQRQALVFLINEVLARGYALEAGQILMTGSIGGMVPAQPGRYAASFGALGELSCEIT